MATAANRPGARSELLVSTRVPVYLRQVEELTGSTVAKANEFERVKRQFTRQQIVVVSIVAVLCLATVFGVWVVIETHDSCNPTTVQLAGQTVRVCS